MGGSPGPSFPINWKSKQITLGGSSVEGYAGINKKNNMEDDSFGLPINPIFVPIIINEMMHMGDHNSDISSSIDTISDSSQSHDFSSDSNSNIDSGSSFDSGMSSFDSSSNGGGGW